MYRVTWEETRIALHEARQPHVLADGRVGLRRVTARSMPLISFPWLFHNELGKIALNAERLPSLDEFAAKPETSVEAEPPKGSVGLLSQELELDWAAMDYVRTSDSQCIHRGEILNLFRHDDEDGEEGFYCSEDVLGTSCNDEVSDKSPAMGEAADTDPALLDLDMAADGDGGSFSGSSATSLINQAVVVTLAASSPSKTTSSAEIAVVDLLSSDTNTASDLSLCLTPDKVQSGQQQQQHDLKRVNVQQNAKMEQPQPDTDDTEARPIVEQQNEQKHNEAGKMAKRDTGVATSPKSANNTNWDTVPYTTTLTRTTTAAAALSRPSSPSDDELPPLKYIAIPATTASTRTQYPSFYSPTTPSASYTPWDPPANGHGRSDVVVNDTGQQTQSRSLGHSHGFPRGEKRSEGRRESGKSWSDDLATALAGSFGDKNEVATTNESDGDGEGVEYEEEVVLLESETAMERTARFT
jgi:hypothetical protein